MLRRAKQTKRQIIEQLNRRILNEQESNVMTLPEIQGLTKQKQNGGVYYSVLHNDGKKRLFFITVRPNTATKGTFNVGGGTFNSSFFPLAEETYNLIKKIDAEEGYSGQEKLTKDEDSVGFTFNMKPEILNKVMNSLRSSLPSLLKKYKVEKLKKKINEANIRVLKETPESKIFQDKGMGKTPLGEDDDDIDITPEFLGPGIVIKEKDEVDLPTVRREDSDRLRRKPYSAKARFRAGLGKSL